MLGVFKARSPDAWTGGAGRGAAQLELGRSGTARKTAEHHRRDGARARGSPLYFTRIAAAPRGRERTRAPGYSAPRSGRLQEWSAAARDDAVPAH